MKIVKRSIMAMGIAMKIKLKTTITMSNAMRFRLKSIKRVTMTVSIIAKVVMIEGQCRNLVAV